MKEDFVPFEVAGLLKENGFDEYCFMAYYKDGSINDIMDMYGEVEICNSECCEGDITAPTLQMAMKWLREMHNIDIDIDAHCGMLGLKKYCAYVSTYEPYKLTETDKEFGITEDEIKGRFVQHKRNTRIPDSNELIPAHEYFDTYEQASEKAIKYCLTNLI